MKVCPWCGKDLEIKVLDLGDKFRHVCSRCSWKIKEIGKPKPQKPKEQEENPIVVPIKPEEAPKIKQAPIWPFILGAVALILIIIILVKIFLV